jgi:hypothetical protein
MIYSDSNSYGNSNYTKIYIATENETPVPFIEQYNGCTETMEDIYESKCRLSINNY